LKILTFAAIDIGSNAMRLLLTNVVENGKTPVFRKTTLIRVPVRLGDEAFSEKRLSDKKVNTLLLAIKSFKYLMDATGIESYRACATSAMREAVNSAEIVKMIAKESGIKIEVIGGKEEADIIYSTHVEEMLDHKNSYLYVDVGGGSTELTLFAKNKLVDSRSFNLGAVRYLKGIVNKEDEKDLKKWVKKTTAKHKPLHVIGSGGNINKIFKISGIKTKKNASITIDQVKNF
jgi:exopolyphosphatase / guanosine-5'-triphosphate,3'-diphosphate pyrophosphatase